MAQVFRLKVADLLLLLQHDGTFGRFLGVVWTIEYQKRGLPHLHLLLFLHSDDRLHDAARIDDVVSAEFPAPEDDESGEILEVVRSCMTHGPCGVHAPKAPCMINGKCSKHYPRDFTEEMQVQANGYPLYCRRQDGRRFARSADAVAGSRFKFDSRWVVPHNRFLCRRFKAHINVEVCASIKAIKYIHKYIYKGSDCTTVQLQGSEDEVAQYLQGRYIGPTKVMWHLFEYPVHEEWPPVIHLGLHLPNEQPVFFGADSTLTELQAKLDASHSTLMAFFDYNRDNTDGRQYLYQEFPVHFVYKKPRCQWHPRQKGTAIGRMYHCNPFVGERYYLRLLLTVVRGPQSFEHLRTVNGVEQPTFHGACLALGLLQDDNEWVDCFTEAVTFSSGTSLRTLFATALLHGSVLEPVQLWNRFRNHICDDLLHRMQLLDIVPTAMEQPEFDYGLYLIQDILADFDKTLADFRLPAYVHDWGRNAGNPLLAAELDYNLEKEATLAAEQTTQLNVEQRHCFDVITHAIETQPQTAHFFLQGAGGTGKTFLYCTICNHYRAAGKVVLCVASSGIAALLLPGGRTSHSRFKIPLSIHEGTTCNVTKNSQLADLLRSTGLIIWDEVLMQHKLCFEAVHRTLQDMRSNDHTFGGIPTILGGDFAQILPVVQKGSRAATVGACIQRSFLWPHLRLLQLHRNMRLQISPANEDFANWQVQLSYNPVLRGHIQLPSTLMQLRAVEDFQERLFPTAVLQRPRIDPAFFRDQAILCVRNDIVNDSNADILKRLHGDMHIFDSVDSADVNEAEAGHEELAQEYLRSLSPAGMPPARLCLKVGAPIILLRNLYPKQGLCNGTRMTVTQLGHKCIEVRMLGGDFDGQLRLLPRIQLSTPEGEYPFILMRKQFLVSLCFAMTVNKAQGQSLPSVGIDLRSPAFTHGQLYVALSRVMNLANLTVLLPDDGDGRTDNIVYSEVLISP